MFNYRPLRIILMDRKIKPSSLCKKVGLSHNVGRKIINDENIEVSSLILICRELGIGLDDAVSIEKNE